MLDQIPHEALTMGAAAVGGFLMKAKALDIESRKQEHLHAIDAFKVGMGASNDSANSAAGRIGDSWGKMTRRFIAWGLVLGVMLLAFFPGFFDAPAIVQTVKESDGWLFGLFGGGSKVEFHELNGFIHSPVILTGFAHVVAFYFGQAAAKP